MYTFPNTLQWQRLQTLLITVTVAVALSAVWQSRATTFIWNVPASLTGDASGSWSVQNNWLNGTLPTTTNDTAYFNNITLTTNSTVTLDGNQSIGIIIFGDYGPSTAADWTLSAGSPVSSTLTVGGTSPTITVQPDGYPETTTISAPVSLGGLVNCNVGTNSLLISGNITSESAEPGLQLAGGSPPGGHLILSGTNVILVAAANSKLGITHIRPNAGTSTDEVDFVSGSTTLSNCVIYAAGGNIVISGGDHHFIGSVANCCGIFLGAGGVMRTLTVTNATVYVSRISMGYGGNTPCMFNMDGGTFIQSPDTSLGGFLLSGDGQAASDLAILNLNGGVLETPNITKSSTSAALAANTIINLNGGTLMAETNTGNFLNGNVKGMTVNVLAGGAVFDTAGFNITVTNALLDGGGGGGLMTFGGGKLTLTGESSYTGTTTVSNGTLEVDGSLASASVTAGLGGKLRGSGTISGSVEVTAGGVVEPGSGTLGTLTVNNLALNSGAGAVFRLDTGNTNGPATNDMLVATGTQDVTGGTITVTNVGPSLQAGDKFTLLSQPTSGFTTVNLPAGYTWGNNLATDGSIQILTVIAPSPTNITYSVSGNQLILNWPTGQGWQLQAQTNNLATGLTTNWFNVTGATPPFTNNINPSNSSVFYRLKF